MATPSYSQQQIIDSLAETANSAFGLTFPNFDALQEYEITVVQQTIADPVIQGYIGDDWQIVWGPVVFSALPDAAAVVSDNGMALYYSLSQNLFVLAIAGTNINSVYDWLDENYDVDTTQLWQAIVGDDIMPQQYQQAVISTGSYTGLSILLGMQNSDGSSMLDTLSAYISESDISNAEIAVAGHSLGGALCQCMGLYMQNLPGSWNSSGGVSVISVYPTAAPTPGDVNFANYYESLIDGASFVFSNRYNSLDVIPQGWEEDTMATVPTIYDSFFNSNSNQIPLPDAVSGPLVATLMMHTYDEQTGTVWQYTHVQPRTSLAGTFDSNGSVDAAALAGIVLSLVLPQSSSLNDYSSSVMGMAAFIAQFTYQHGDGYYISSVLNIQDFMTEYAVIIQDNAPAGQSVPQAKKEALKNAIKHVVNKRPLSRKQASLSAPTA